MRNYLVLFLFLMPSAFAQQLGSDQELLTPWTDQVDQNLPHNEYPRPQMVREQWQNLNGLWDYAIMPGVPRTESVVYTGKILVPYPVESFLSGVGKTVGKDSTLWYKREIILDKKISKNERLILHFGAVDWRMNLYVNGKWIGEHEGGYDPFSFDITDALKKGAKQELVISVWDPTDEGPQPVGKQVKEPKGIWYTSVTGIWQTVWLETVPMQYISGLKMHSDIDRGLLYIHADYGGDLSENSSIHIEVYDKDTMVAELASTDIGQKIIEVKNPKLWSPDSPFLYDLKINLLENGKVVDRVSSYFAFRKISMLPDENEVLRMALNDEFVFHYGTLDQGWWPDGLYTAPSDEALKFDIIKTKEMGFNMIRKHVKVEPARWYYYCDLLGMLVWQDMPNGDYEEHSQWEYNPVRLSGKKLEMDRTEESENIFKKEWKAIMDAFGHFQSIVMWVPFNEGWGQFKTKEITEWTRKYDPTRLVNSASGGNYFKTGDVLDIHNYPEPRLPHPEFFGRDMALVLGEYGGVGLPVDGHTWKNKDNWGYQNLKTAEELRDRYAELTTLLQPLIVEGLSGAVYTQTTDVEIEVNGLMTYDRKVSKIDEKEMYRINQKLYESAKQVNLKR